MRDHRIDGLQHSRAAISQLDAQFLFGTRAVDYRDAANVSDSLRGGRTNERPEGKRMSKDPNETWKTARHPLPGCARHVRLQIVAHARRLGTSSKLHQCVADAAVEVHRWNGKFRVLSGRTQFFDLIGHLRERERESSRCN